MTGTPSRDVILFGTEQKVAPPLVLRAGALSAELEAGNLRYIRIAGVEALRAVSFIVRDKNWGTYNPVIENLKVDEADGGFTVTYDAVCKDAEQEFRYSATITGKSDGTLRFEGKGAAVSDFLTNRTGFVVLHPVSVSGQPVEVLEVDGKTSRSTFPELIDPVQPFMNLRTLTHEVLPGVKVACRMDGDTFEMEDQRNWTDASYKTYVRPLALPWPYPIKAGETTEQAVTLTVAGNMPAASASAASANSTVIQVGGPVGTMPRIGLSVPPQHAAAALDAAGSIRAARPDFLSCYFDPRDGNGVEDMRRFKELGEAVGAPLVLEAVLPTDDTPAAELEQTARQAAEAKADFEAVMVSPAPDLKCTLPGSPWPPCPTAEDIYAAARAAFPGVRLGGGMFSYFTELNRKRPPAALLDFVMHSTSAIVHAGDDRTATENLETLPYIVKTTRSFIDGKPYWINFAAIGMRSNPYGAAPMENPDNGRLAMARMDPRQRGLLGAAWNVGYVAHAAAGGVEAVVLSAPVGEFGIVHHAMPWSQPWFDAAGGVYPVYHVVAGLAQAAGAELLETTSADGREVQAVTCRQDGKTTLWVANLTEEVWDVAVEGLSRDSAAARVMDAASFTAATSGVDGFEALPARPIAGNLRLDAYAVARIDVV